MEEGVFMKKLITGITALLTCAVSLMPLSASAIYIPADSYETIHRQLEGYTFIKEVEVSEKDPNFPNDYELYIKMPNEDEKYCAVKLLMKENYDSIRINLPDANGRQILSDALQQIGIDGKVFHVEKTNYECRLYKTVSNNDIKKLYSLLNDNNLITEFVYSTDLYSIREGITNSESLSRFGFCSYDYDKGIWTPPEEQIAKRDQLVELTKELLPDATVELTSFSDKDEGFTAYEASVVPASNMTLKEWIDFSLEVNEKIGVFGGYAINEDLPPVFKTNNVDVLNAVEGDSNCDEQMDMADAVLIMQALANPNKYGIDGTAEHHLTEQGKFNGDMDGDGITVGDAQAIQCKLLGLE